MDLYIVDQVWCAGNPNWTLNLRLTHDLQLSISAHFRVLCIIMCIIKLYLDYSWPWTTYLFQSSSEVKLHIMNGIYSMTLKSSPSIVINLGNNFKTHQRVKANKFQGITKFDRNLQSHRPSISRSSSCLPDSTTSHSPFILFDRHS